MDPWHCHGEVFNAIIRDWIQRWDNRPYGRIVPSLNLYPSFQILFNVSFVGLCYMPVALPQGLCFIF